MSFLLLNWKLIVIGVLVAATGLMTNLYVGKRDELIAFTAQVKQAGEAQKVETQKREVQFKETLKVIKDQYENTIPEIRANAVTNYLAAHSVRNPSPRSRPVPKTSSSVQVDDSAKLECVPDGAFIENAAEDALKLEAWQDWAKLNGVPVEQ